MSLLDVGIIKVTRFSYSPLAGVGNAEESLGEVTVFQAPKLAFLQILVISASKVLSKVHPNPVQ